MGNPSVVVFRRGKAAGQCQQLYVGQCNNYVFAIVIGNDVGFAFNVPGICCIFDNVAQLVRLPCRVGFLLLTDSRYKAIGVRVENEGSTLDHVAEVTDSPRCP